MVVAKGNTLVLPVGPTAPMPWSMVIPVAPKTFHSRVEISPGETAEGLALKDTILGNCPLASVVACSQAGRDVVTILISPVSGFIINLTQEILDIHRAAVSSRATMIVLMVLILGLMFNLRL